MKITSDWHIHSGNSCDCACMKMSALIESAAAKGITDFGVSDHLHSLYNLPDIQASRREFLACGPGPRFHFGVEASCVSRWELEEIAAGRCQDPVYGIREGGPPGAPLAVALTKEDIRTCGVEYVVGGTHWPIYVPLEREAIIRDYHRQNMFLAAHPLVDIVAHPWWWQGHWEKNGMFNAEPWFDDFDHVPRSMHEEFAATAIQHETVVEINLDANLLNGCYPERFKRQYLDYLAGLAERGVKLCIGSDCHNATYRVDFEKASQMLDSVGIREDHLWRLPPRSEVA